MLIDKAVDGSCFMGEYLVGAEAPPRERLASTNLCYVSIALYSSKLQPHETSNQFIVN